MAKFIAFFFLTSLISGHYFSGQFETLNLGMLWFDKKQNLVIFYGLTVFNQDFDDGPGKLRLDFIHEFHCLDDAKSLPALNMVIDINERICFRRR